MQILKRTNAHARWNKDFWDTEPRDKHRLRNRKPYSKAKVIHKNIAEMSVREIYEGSNGEATTGLYKRLFKLGSIGEIAVYLFRACKTSERAKVYRGGISGKGSYRSMSYDRKNDSLEKLCNVLTNCADKYEITWGWKKDYRQEKHSWVLYVDLHGIGQMSFHSETRYIGPKYYGKWDGKSESAKNVITFVDRVLNEYKTDEQVKDIQEAEPAKTSGRKYLCQVCSWSMLENQVNTINLYEEEKQNADILDTIALCGRCAEKINRMRLSGKSLLVSFKMLYEYTSKKSFDEFNAKILKRNEQCQKALIAAN